MSGDQWFRLWLAVAQVGVGAIVTVVAVFIGARLALGRERQRALEDRSRQAAEKLIFGLDDCTTQLGAFYDTIEFVIEPKPSTVSDLTAKDMDLNEIVDKASATIDDVSMEVFFLKSSRSQEALRWMTISLLDLKAIVAAAQIYQSCSTDKISAALEGTMRCAIQARDALLCYSRGEPIFPVEKPIHWIIPADVVSRIVPDSHPDSRRSTRRGGR